MTGIAPSSGYPHPGPDPKGTTTEERSIRAIDGSRLTLSAPLQFEHLGAGLYRGEVANLSRNVVVESADPKGERGHTMYHKYSAGSISYAEFRHLGKEGILGKYAIHYHLCGDSMRGSSARHGRFEAYAEDTAGNVRKEAACHAHHTFRPASA